MKVGGRIRKIRLDLGLTQSDFAERLGLSQSVLSLIEANKSALTIDNLHKLSREFGANCMWLIFGEQGFRRNMAAQNLIPMLKPGDVKEIFQSQQTVLPGNSEYYKIPFFDNPSYRLFVVNDEAMGPTLLEGDLVVGLISEDKSGWMSGSIIGVWRHNNLQFRRAFHRRDSSLIWLVGEGQEMARSSFDLEQSPFIVKVLGKVSSRFAEESQIQMARLNSCESDLKDLWRELQELRSTANSSWSH